MQPFSGWYADPMRRHELRFWDGTAWTEHAFSRNVQYVDPINTAAPQALQGAESHAAHAISLVGLPATNKSHSAAAVAASPVHPPEDRSRPAPKASKVNRPEKEQTEQDRKRLARKMSDPAPNTDGWYPDPETGGTRYAHKRRWTGDVRPPRRAFSAPGHESIGWAALPFGGFFVVLSLFSPTWDDGSMTVGGRVGLFFGLFGAGLILVLLAIYLLRGRGPATSDIEERIAQEEKEASARRRSANIASFFSGFGRKSRSSSDRTSGEAVTVAQIRAISNPDTAKSLQNLQNLLYTQALTDDEYQAAKDKLLKPQEKSDPTEQIEQLAELHRDGVLGDLEFASAKARILGL